MAQYTPNSTFETRIASVIGDEFADINGSVNIKDVFDATVKEFVPMLPSELVYARGSYSTANGNKFEVTDANGTSMAGKIFIRAFRKSGSIYKLCEMVDLDTWFSASDSNSIYAASVVSPICTINESNLLRILPDPDGTDQARIYAFDAAYNESDSTSLTSTDIGYNADIAQGKGLYAVIIPGLPIEANEALIYKAAVNMLTAFISDAVQGDEDTEILNLYTAQIQFLNSKFTAEMARLGVKPEEPVEV